MNEALLVYAIVLHLIPESYNDGSAQLKVVHCRSSGREASALRVFSSFLPAAFALFACASPPEFLRQLRGVRQECGGLLDR